MIALRKSKSTSSTEEKESMVAASTSYNRHDPVDLDIFRSYTTRYRRLTKLYTAHTAVREARQGSGISLSGFYVVVCQYCPFHNYFLGPYLRPQTTMKRILPFPTKDEPNAQHAAAENVILEEERPASPENMRSPSISSMSSTSSTPTTVRSKKSVFLLPFKKKKKKATDSTSVNLVKNKPSTETPSPSREGYKESITRLHLERLVVEIVFWEAVLSRLSALYSWRNPLRTAFAAWGYFYLWKYNLIPAALFLYLGYYLLSYRLDPASFNSMRSQVRARIVDVLQTESMLGKLRRGTRLDLLHLHKRFAETYGETAQSFAESMADFNERGENLILWRDPAASWRGVITSFFLAIICLSASPATLWKTLLLVIGCTFFMAKPFSRLMTQQFQLQPSCE